MWGSIFPGQGSQYSGMGQFLFENFISTQLRFEEASDLLNLNFKKLCFESAESELALTENTQPALLLVSTCLNEALKNSTPYPIEITSGHSIGEYGALVSADVLSFEHALKAVRVRGKAMQEAVPVGQGGMLAVMGLNPNQVQKICEWTVKESQEGPLEPANYNAPGQIVISGSIKAIEFLRAHYKPEILEEAPKKVRFIPLKVSAPFHCSMMKPAQETMSQLLNDTPFLNPQFGVVQNVSAKVESLATHIKSNLIEQVTQSVRWVECIQAMKTSGVTSMIEMGSGKVLSGLVKKMDSDIKIYNINSLDEFKEVENVLTQK